MISVHRIDAEASNLKKKLEELTSSQKPSNKGQDKASEGTTSEPIEVSLVMVIICCFVSNGFSLVDRVHRLGDILKCYF